LFTKRGRLLSVLEYKYVFFFFFYGLPITRWRRSPGKVRPMEIGPWPSVRSWRFFRAFFQSRKTLF
jgi:hypothetical protein